MGSRKKVSHGFFTYVTDGKNKGSISKKQKKL
jgi:hypothetical protein